MKKSKKIKAKDRYGKTIIYIRIDNALLDLISVLRDFYGYKTRNELFPYLIILSVLDIASLPKDSNWIPSQLKAWRASKTLASNFGDSIVISAARQVLKKQKPNTKMTASQLANKTKKELKNADKLNT